MIIQFGHMFLTIGNWIIKLVVIVLTAIIVGLCVWAVQFILRNHGAPYINRVKEKKTKSENKDTPIRENTKPETGRKERQKKERQEKAAPKESAQKERQNKEQLNKEKHIWDPFGKKRIKELEQILEYRDDEIVKLEHKLQYYSEQANDMDAKVNRKNDEIQNLKERLDKTENDYYKLKKFNNESNNMQSIMNLLGIEYINDGQALNAVENAVKSLTDNGSKKYKEELEKEKNRFKETEDYYKKIYSKILGVNKNDERAKENLLREIKKSRYSNGAMLSILETCETIYDNGINFEALKWEVNKILDTVERYKRNLEEL